MSFYGSLSSMNIADLLQNMETNGRTGTLSIEGPRGRAWIYFRDGGISMLAADNRPDLFERLVTYGSLSSQQFDKVRHRRRGTRKSLVETVVQMKLLSREQLAQATEQFLIEDVCELVMNAEGDFRFREGAVPARTFDPEERALDLRIAPGPLLLEAARREDHWRMLRKTIPSESVHFFLPRDAELPADVGDPQLAVQVVDKLDGTRDVREVLSFFPGRRFQVYETLAALIRHRIVEAVEADGLLTIASKIGSTDAPRARRLLADALREQPKHQGLLDMESQLAEQMGDFESAAAALKMIAHLKIEEQEFTEAKKTLERAKRLAPGDTAVWERLVALEVDEGHVDEAVAAGLELVQLYREPGLHAKARDVLERLVDLEPTSVQLRSELARSQVDSGDPRAAVRSLCRQGKVLIGREEYANARRLFEEVLAIDNAHREAKRSISMIDTEAFRRRRDRRRRLVRRLAAAAVVAAILTGLFHDYSARVALAEATTKISQEHLIEDMRYDDAIKHLEQVAESHYLTPTYFIDVRARLDELRKKAKKRKLEQG